MPRPTRSKLLARLSIGCALIAATLSTTGCTSVGYYRQAISGHLDVMLNRVAIDKLLHNEDTQDDLKGKLALVLKARDFASDALLLPRNDSYRSYVDLGRPYVVWNIFATPELSLQPVRSCFLFAGCLSYRGFFAETEARAAAAALRADGHDVFVGGVAAYSTLGWFDDPLLNTMLVWGEPRIVEVIFHELAHQLLYAADDSVFNESFATAVAEIGLERWFSDRPEIRSAVLEDDRREAEFNALLKTYRGKLEQAFERDTDAATKRADKAQLLEELVDDYNILKASWGGYDAYDTWIKTDLNNAKIASIATYNDYVPAFRSILASVDYDLAKFYPIVEKLKSWTPEQRARCLGEWTAGGSCWHEIQSSP